MWSGNVPHASQCFAPKDIIMKIQKALNSKGRLAKDLEMSIKQAHWLSLLCTLWLQYNNEDVVRARTSEPVASLPRAFPESPRYNKARTECKAWEPKRSTVPTYKYRVLKSGKGKWVRAGGSTDNQFTLSHPEPPASKCWDWPWVFEYWRSGGLDRDAKALMKNLPKENRLAIEKELLK